MPSADRITQTGKAVTGKHSPRRSGSGEKAGTLARDTCCIVAGCAMFAATAVSAEREFRLLLKLFAAL